MKYHNLVSRSPTRSTTSRGIMIDALETYPASKGMPVSTRQLRSSDRIALNRGNHRASHDRFPKKADRTVGSDLTDACTEPSLLYRALPTAPTSGCVSRKLARWSSAPGCTSVSLFNRYTNRPRDFAIPRLFEYA